MHHTGVVAPRLSDSRSGTRRALSLAARCAWCIPSSQHAMIASAMSVSILDREIFSESWCRATPARSAQGTLNYWLNGGSVVGARIRRSSEPSRATGAGCDVGRVRRGRLLRGYRRDLQVPMVEARAFVDLLRARFEIPLPARARATSSSARASSWSGPPRRKPNSTPSSA